MSEVSHLGFFFAAIQSAIDSAIQFPDQKEVFAIEDKFTCKVEMPSKDAPAQPVKSISRQPSTEHRGSMFYVAPEEDKDSDDENGISKLLNRRCYLNEISW